MKLRAVVKKLRDSRGQSLVEFALCAVLLLLVLFSVLELSNLVMVYNTVANGAREGVRYAITHSSVPCGAGTCTAVTTANVSTMETNVQNAVQSVLGGAMNSSAATVVVSYPDCSACTSPLPTTPTAASHTTPGYRVRVTVSYPYAPFVSYLPLSFTMTSASEGVITW